MPSITGGSQFEAGYGDHLPHAEPSFTPIKPKETGLQSIADLQEKRDFENLDVRLYLALKAMLPHWEAMSEQGCIEGGVEYIRSEDEELMAAEKVMRDFEDSHGPLPEWAVARNFGYELLPGAQLCTKDGRRTGNAHIVSIEVKGYKHLADRNNPYGEVTVYNCLTDAGSHFAFTAEELETAFTIGDWLSSPERILEDFDRHGHFTEEPL